MTAAWIVSPRCISENTSNGHQLIACAPSGKAGTQEWAENARLMAAAREMFAALEAILPFCAKTSASEGGAAKFAASVAAADMVRGAISKASAP